MTKIETLKQEVREVGGTYRTDCGESLGERTESRWFDDSRSEPDSWHQGRRPALVGTG